MYIPAAFAMDELQQQHDFIQQFSFGILLSESLEATHIPFVLKREQGEFGTLYCHLARANPHWRELADSRVLCIFSGPNAYVSPTWYASAPNVPTWNYVAVHAYGTAKLLDEAGTLDVVERMVRHYEPELLRNQSVFDTSHNQKLAKAIVGLRIEIDRIQGKAKLGQNRSAEDQQCLSQALEQQVDSNTQQLLQFIQSQYLS